MIRFLPNVLSADECQYFRTFKQHVPWTDPIINNLCYDISEIAAINTADPAYARVETRKEGHPWHTDKGTQGHMQWCTFAASILLSHPDEFAGGRYQTRTEYAPVEQGMMVLTSSDVEHKVHKHSGDRTVLLMFFT